MRYGWNPSYMFSGGGFTLLLIWALFWKGLALWKAAREENKYWFIALLVLQTYGIVEIAYLFFFAKDKMSLSSMSSSPKKPAKSKSKKKK